jgi:hypothetical protein
MTILEQLDLLIKCVGKGNHPEFRLTKETGETLRKLVGSGFEPDGVPRGYLRAHFTMVNGVYHYKGIPLIEDPTAPPEEVYLLSKGEID